MARISSGTIVAGLTVAALVGVGVLAAQASGSAPANATATGPRGSASASPTPRTSASAPQTFALPSGSGSGARVVYSLDQDRVWLVSTADKVSQTFPVSPGSVDPSPGRYTVVSRSESGLGGDGVAIEHVVRFTTASGVVIGFSAAQDGSSPSRDAGQKTGGIRETRADGTAMWAAAPLGTQVFVVS